MNLRSPSRPTSQQRGAALLVALAIIALASFIALQMTQRLELDIARTTNINRNFIASEYARGLEALARNLLRQDFIDSGQVDTLTETWAQPLPPLPVPGGTVTGVMTDLNGRFNVNWLVTDGQADESRVDMLRRLLVALELNDALADTITDWIDSDSIPRSNGAESAIYAERTPPYRSANRPMAHISELRLIAGVNDEIYRRLEPHLAAIPRNANLRRINVNTATPEVLMALDSSINRAQAERLTQNGSASFNTLEEFLNHPAMDGVVLPQAASLLSVTSSHFLARAVVVLDDIPRFYFILLERDGNSYHVLHRSYGSP